MSWVTRQYKSMNRLLMKTKFNRIKTYPSFVFISKTENSELKSEEKCDSRKSCNHQCMN